MGTDDEVEVVIDRDRCVGHARCMTIAGEVYDLDDEGKSVALENPVRGDMVPLARDGAESCPERAIKIRPVD